MPFIKPIELFRLQKAASVAVSTDMVLAEELRSHVKGDIGLCVVCGESDCDEDVFMINDYIFHESAVENAEKVEVVE